MSGGLERLIARVAHGRQDVRPLGPTMFEEDGEAGKWDGGQIEETVQHGPAHDRAAPAPARSASADRRSTPAMPAASLASSPQVPEPRREPLPQAHPTERLPRSPKVALQSEHRPIAGRPAADAPLPRRQTVDATAPPAVPRLQPPVTPPASSQPPLQQERQELVETIESNSIVIEIGRIEVKAPPVAHPQPPAAQPQRRAARVSLDAYLAERGAAKR